MPHLERPKRSFPDLAAAPMELGETKQKWVYRQLVTSIQDRRLLPGAIVPSTRALSMRWKISRGTVELAFEQLQHEGYIHSVPGHGTLVSPIVPDTFVLSSSLNEVPPPLKMEKGTTASVLENIENHGRAGFPLDVLRGTQEGLPFVARLPNLEEFDISAWRESIKNAASQLDDSNLSSRDPKGLLSLREQIQRHLASTRGICCDVDDLVIVTGIRHAIDLCAQLALNASLRVAIEDPGCMAAQNIFSLRGCHMVDIPVDEEGLVVERLNEVPEVGGVYITPAHQAPTGVTMSIARRTALLEWAHRTQAWILEDDYDSDFNYESAPLPALKAIDSYDRVIFCGSFNKSLFPSLRIGYMVVPKALSSLLITMRRDTGRSNPILDQLTLTHFIESGKLWGHLKKARMSYLEKRDLVLNMLPESAGRSLTFHGTHTGFHCLLEIPAGISEDKLIEGGKQKGLLLQSLRGFHRVAAYNTPMLVLGYTALTKSQIRMGVQMLGSLLRECQ